MHSIEDTINSLQITHNLHDDIIQLGVAFINYAQSHRAIFLLGIRESYRYPQTIQKLPERLMKLLDDWLINVY